MTAAATVSETGDLALQGQQAAEGLNWWAARSEVELELADDTSSSSVACDAYRRWVDQDVDVLVGPYGSNLVRTVTPLVTGTGKLLWNHGGSADDLAHSLVIPLPAPASTYFQEVVEIAGETRAEEILLVVGRGRFANAVASGARATAARVGLPVREFPIANMPAVASEAHKGAVLVVATFGQDLEAIGILNDVHPPLIACVAAGLPEFGRRLGRAADGVFGPVQWIPESTIPEIGPSGAEFARDYRAMFAQPPSYVAAQAAAAGVLAEEAHLLGLSHEEVRRWRTSTLLGSFALDDSWRQAGHRAHTICWQDGRQATLS